jgi:glutamyl-tRNA reductase
VQSFAHWLDQRAAVPLIQALNRQADDWGAAELGRARKLLAGRTGRAVLEALARGLTHKMLHGTMAELHAADGADASNWRTPCRACSCARASAGPGESGDPGR